MPRETRMAAPVSSDWLCTIAGLIQTLCAVLSQNSCDIVIVVCDCIIQGCLPTMSGCTPIDIGAVGDEDYRGSPICVPVAATA
jgi:hypothetical protein